MLIDGSATSAQIARKEYTVRKTLRPTPESCRCDLIAFLVLLARPPGANRLARIALDEGLRRESGLVRVGRRESGLVREQSVGFALGEAVLAAFRLGAAILAGIELDEAPSSTRSEIPADAPHQARFLPTPTRAMPIRYWSQFVLTPCLT